MWKTRGCPGAALLPRSVGVARQGPWARVPPTAAARIPRPASTGAAPAGWGLVHPGVSHVWVGMVMRTFSQPLCVLDLFSLQHFNGCSPLCTTAYPQGGLIPTVFHQRFFFSSPVFLIIISHVHIDWFCADFASIRAY